MRSRRHQKELRRESKMKSCERKKEKREKEEERKRRKIKLTMFISVARNATFFH